MNTLAPSSLDLPRDIASCNSDNPQWSHDTTVVGNSAVHSAGLVLTSSRHPSSSSVAFALPAAPPVTKATAGHITTSKTTGVMMSQDIKELWSSTLRCLYSEMKEIGKALTCSICQSTFQQPVMLQCVHAFCMECLQQSLQVLRKCPICMRKATPRSIVHAPFLEGVVKSYKELLRSFGMTPIVYDETVAMTQLPPSPNDYDHDDDEEDENEPCKSHDDNNHTFPTTQSNEFDPKKGVPSLEECSTHLALSRLWQQAFLQEKQQLPANCDLERKKLSSLLEDQNRVVQVDERVLIRSMKAHFASGVPSASSISTILHPMLQEPYHTDDGISTCSPMMIMDNPRPPQLKGEGMYNPELPGLSQNSNNNRAASPIHDKCSNLLTVSQIAHEECMEDARDQHTANRLADIALEEEERKEQATDVNPLDGSVRPPRVLRNGPVNSMDPFSQQVKKKQRQKWRTVRRAKNNDHVPQATESGSGKKGIMSLGAYESDITCTEKLPQENPPVVGMADVVMDAIDFTSNTMEPRFAVGDIVEVQRRMWPGINKPGGTARVTMIHVEGDTCFYDVAYVLGGKERKVVAGYVSTPNDGILGWYRTDDTNNDTTEPARKSRRIDSGSIPTALLEELAAQGYDVGGTKIKAKLAPVGNRRLHSKVSSKSHHLSSTISKEPTPTNDAVTDGELEVATTTAKNQEDKVVPNHGNESTQELDGKCKKRKQNGFIFQLAYRKKPKRPTEEDTMGLTNRVDVVLTDEEKCNQADQAYTNLFDAALSKGSIYVVASGLNDIDKASLAALCKQSNKNTSAKIILSDTFHPGKTTLCIVSTEIRDGPNLIARCRTLKVMRATLAGIPIVDASWIKACQKNNDVISPEPDMFVRSLPTKTGGIDQTSNGGPTIGFGVASLAARLQKAKIVGTSSSNTALPLHNVCVFMCGLFHSPQKLDIQVLLREAGSSKLVSNTAAMIKLKTAPSPAKARSTIVLLCDDENSNERCGITSSLAATTSEAIQQRNLDVLVVNTQWLFDSISCGEKLPPHDYRPYSSLAGSLWEMTISLS